MSRKKPIILEYEGRIKVNPTDIYSAKVIASGNGAVISSFKRYIGKKVVVIVGDKIVNKINKKEKADSEDMADITEMSGMMHGS